MIQSDKIRVLIVDDSPMVRSILSRVLRRDPQIEVVGTAADPYEARDLILELHPNVVSLDIEMPRLDGISFLKVLKKHHPIPVVIVSSVAQAGSAKAYEALEAGAVEVIGKPQNSAHMDEFEHEYVQKIKSAALARFPSRTLASSLNDEDQGRDFAADQIVLLGASTGGVEALKEVLAPLPKEMPPICIVQHIPAYISARFANRLNDICALEVREAQDGDVLQSGMVAVAPGGYHMLLHRSGGQYYVQLQQTPAVNFQRPSVDVLFSSAAISAGRKAVAALLTGMGKDGAEGLRQLKNAGAVTIAQNEATCVVYGMPRAAVELGAVRHVLALEKIAPAIVRSLKSKG